MRLLAAILICATLASGQDIIKPDKHYLDRLHHDQKLAARRQKRFAKYQAADEKDAIEQMGMEKWLADHIPPKHGLDPKLELFTPQPDPPKTDKPEASK